jgi:hypothetical protein
MMACEFRLSLIGNSVPWHAALFPAASPKLSALLMLAIPIHRL